MAQRSVVRKPPLGGGDPHQPAGDGASTVSQPADTPLTGAGGGGGGGGATTAAQQGMSAFGAASPSPISASPLLGAADSDSEEKRNENQQGIQGASELALMVGHKDHQQLRRMGGIHGIKDTLATDLSIGLTLASIGSRVSRYGRNELPPEQLSTFYDFVKESLEDKTMLILIGSAVVSLVMGMTTPDPRSGEVDRSTGWIEGFAILLSVSIVVLLTAINNFQKQEQFTSIATAEKLAAVVVVREGAVSELAPADCVVGDVVMVFSGMSMPFDALLFEGNGFTADECSLTGELEDVHKSAENDPFLISGTNIVDGCDGLALVVAVGQTSFAGSIAMTVREKKKDTPLQEQLSTMADLIGYYGLLAAVFTFAVLFLKELWVIMFHGGTFYAMKFFENLTTSVAIVVVAVPEGLPLSVTLSLAYSMKRMFQDGNLVRHLAACETMGGATCICSDKTGTLTHTEIRPRLLVVERHKFDVAGTDTVKLKQTSPLATKHLIDAIAYNFGATYGNNKTGEALVSLCHRCQQNVGYNAIADARDLPKNHMQRFAFSSMRKQGSVVVRNDAGALVHHVIGAAELVFQRCNTVLHEGKKVSFHGELRRQWEAALRESTAEGLRTVCVAYSERTTNWSELPRVAPEDPLTLVAIVGIEEPIRVEVPNALALCRSAGIRVIMVTGDNSATALNIAQRSGLSHAESGGLVEGSVFRTMTDEEVISSVLPTLTVLARATPIDKRRLVNLLRHDPTQVIAVTGDGTNDAPALKSACVGFSMNTGSDIAKQASDIVLLEDNFAGVVKAAMWGRNVKGNIRKFLQFQLTVNLVACIVAFCGAVLNSQNMSPLKPVQLLWLNLIMDTLAALALATELPSENHLLSLPPDPKGSPIITKAMRYNIVSQTGFQLLAQIVLMTTAHKFFIVKYFDELHLTVVFNTFVMMQVFNFFNARLIHGETSLLQNWRASQTLLGIVAAIFLTQVAIIQRGGKFMATVPLDFAQWCFCIAVGSVSLPIGTATRWYYRYRKSITIRESDTPPKNFGTPV